MPLAHERSLAAAELLRRTGGEIESTVRGRSMGATLPAGTRIRIACRRDAAFADGAVVAFLAGGTLVGHRVVGRCRDLRGREALVTRGDGSVFCDPVIDPASVVGEVMAWQSGAAWLALAPAPRRGPFGTLMAAFVLRCVRTLARIDRPLVSTAHEFVLVATQRTRGMLAHLLGSHG